MNCWQVHDRMSDYLDEISEPREAMAIRDHLARCPDCSAMLSAMREVIQWGREFPEFSPPDWLLGRIMARTRRIQKETWADTLRTLAGWVYESRSVVATCASVVCLVWLLSAAPLAPVDSVEGPMAVYYRLDRIVGRAYDQAVRFYHRVPIVTEIQVRIDEIRENFG